jgi:hypothetical protein
MDTKQFKSRFVVAQVEFERHVLKSGLIFKGKGLKPAALLSRYGSECRATECDVHRPAA